MLAWPALATASPHNAFRTGFTPLFHRSADLPVLSITDAMVAASPDALDWSTKGAVTPVKDQGHCSSCWAYSTAESIESATFMQTGKLPSLSEQQLISCDTTDQGCRGGDPPLAYKWVETHGLATQASYPDSSANTSTPGACESKPKSAVKVSSWAYAVPPCTEGSCTSQNEAGLKAALAAHGPLSVCVNAEESDPQPDSADWFGYKSGVLQGTCKGSARELDHCVQLVGYNSSAKWWKVRNSWGGKWGMGGYILLPMGVNSCGIADEATVVTGVTVLPTEDDYDSAAAVDAATVEAAAEAAVSAVEEVAALPATHTAMEASIDVAAAAARWVRGARAPRDASVELFVQLSLPDGAAARLSRLLAAVSDPTSAQYGAHRTPTQLAKLLAVPEARVSKVERFLREKLRASRVELTATRDGFHVSAPVAAVEETLATELHLYSSSHHRTTGTTTTADASAPPPIVRASSGYSLPTEIASEIAVVGGLLQFPVPRNRERAVPADTTPVASSSPEVAAVPNSCARNCDGFVTPQFIATQYAVPDAARAAAQPKANSMAVAEFEQEFFKPEDLVTFGTACGVDVAVANVVGKNGDSAGDECELDIEYMGGLAPKVPLTMVYQDAFDLLGWASTVAALPSPPLLHSISWASDEKQTSAEYRAACEVAFMKAAVRGVSILVASGDYGVCGDEGCETLDHGHETVRFKPMFPASSAYVTSVGGTDLTGDSTGAETAWTRSGGGFSDTFAMPAYQQAAVAAYKASADADLPDAAKWNATGRGFPDVAALGGKKNPYCTYGGGEWGGEAGTSASTPVVGAVFALLNGLRLAAKKPPLGFLNPLIYQHASDGSFRDVTSGCNTNGYRYGGFAAIKGWDPATGVGTPLYSKLAEVVLALPCPTCAATADASASPDAAATADAAASSPDVASSDGAFEAWAAEHGRSYASPEEHSRRRAIFASNAAFVAEHSGRFASGTETYEVALNLFADLTLEEFRTTYASCAVAGARPPPPASEAAAAEVEAARRRLLEVDARALPTSMDWRARGAVTAVKNQGQCGSCWAFSTTGAVEGAHAIKSGELFSLSEQELLECDTTDDGCGGGDMQSAFAFIERSGGLCTEAAYPYANTTRIDGKVGACKAAGCTSRVSVTGFRALPQNNETALRVAVGSVGPVSVSIEADQKGFQFYKSGVFSGACGTNLDHGVLVVGYGEVASPAAATAVTTTSTDPPSAQCSAHPVCSAQGWTGNCCPRQPGDMLKCCDAPVPNASVPYWTVKNSWTTRWGEEGYIRLRRDVSSNAGMCGLAIAPSYPVV